jgi:esterase/lipase superfamily enzyme
MHRDHHSWYSHRLSRDMGVNVYGHYGMPILAFPTSMGDEHEQEGQGMVRTLGPYIEQGRIRFFSINGVQSDSFSNKAAHPFHRSWLQAQYDDYVAREVFPFIDSQCQTPGIPITTYGASLGAYHAANTLFKHPDRVKRCYALSGVYDMRDSMDGMYDDNFYFNNPVDYMANQNDPWFLHQLASCDIHLATGCGPWEVPGPTYQMSAVLASRGIAHHLDDWGPKGGHEWPYWHHQMWEYVGAHF